jgi:hypothetical protein
VLSPDGVPIEPVERYLAFLTDVDRSPNTVKAYAHDLKDWFVFLTGRGLDWREVRLEDVGEFVAWLRLPLVARDGRVAVLPSVAQHCVVAPVPAPHQQVPAGRAAGDRVEGAAQAPADPDRRRDAGDPGCV